MPEHDPEQELGPKISSAFQNKADASDLTGSGMAREARRRVRKRRQTLTMAAAAAVVAIAIGGVWSAVGIEVPTASNSSSDSGAKEAAGSGTGLSSPGILPNKGDAACPPDHPILKAGGHNFVADGTGLDLATPVTGLQACRYRLTPDATGLLGQQRFNAEVAQQVVDAIKVLPERNPALPVFKCTPQTAQPSEAVVLRFDTADGIREVWVEYDGCDSAGFFTGTHTYGLFSAPLKLFMVGSVRPAGGTFLSALGDW
ncbi:hypothetical protein E0H73_25850 [Kribbella pittospori]|uniref:Uncharacterized protein n=1 Tax=Kribbella pittospori TaxID=722689 RepID=A0A4R0KED4_9ACTN|nr:hypothetical protein [Kribbella pittospori]TCC58741.1 hypothetical protein E0H73_25850 [Kribbella pittospori]